MVHIVQVNKAKNLIVFTNNWPKSRKNPGLVATGMDKASRNKMQLKIVYIVLCPRDSTINYIT